MNKALKIQFLGLNISIKFDEMLNDTFVVFLFWFFAFMGRLKRFLTKLVLTSGHEYMVWSVCGYATTIETKFRKK